MKKRILFLDIDGVLNDHSALNLYGPGAILPNCVELMNEVFDYSTPEVIVISNRAQTMGLNRLKEYLTERGLKTAYIIDAIQPVPMDNSGLVLGIEKDKFILDYITKNNITNYVVVDDNLQTDLIPRERIVSPNTYVGMTEKEKNKLIEILK